MYSIIQRPIRSNQAASREEYQEVNGLPFDRSVRSHLFY
jgi:hypothetical protein